VDKHQIIRRIEYLSKKLGEEEAWKEMRYWLENKATLKELENLYRNLVKSYYERKKSQKRKRRDVSLTRRIFGV
jgi:hypothetical protein